MSIKCINCDEVFNTNDVDKIQKHTCPSSKSDAYFSMLMLIFAIGLIIYQVVQG